MNTENIVQALALVVAIFTSVVTYLSVMKAKKLEKTLEAKKEAYDKFLESLSNYIFSSDGETIKQFQASRFRLSLYSSDETIREFLKALPSEAKGKYNINDPVSIILYAIRKEINPKSNITREEMACIDPSQYEMRISRQTKP